MSKIFYIKQNDLWPPLESYLRQGNNESITLTDGTDEVQLTVVHKRRPKNTIIDHKPVDIIDGSLGLVSYTWEVPETTIAGEFLGEFLVLLNGDIPIRVPNEGYFDILISEQLPKGTIVNGS